MELYNEENAPPTVLESFGERIERLEGKIEREREAGKIDVVLQGAENGLDVSILAKITGFTEARIKEILEEH